MYRRFRNEDGDIIESMLWITMMFMVAVLAIKLCVSYISDAGVTGVIIEKKYHEASYSQDFTLGERVVEEKEQYLFMLDTDEDGEADTEQKVSNETYEAYKTGEKFDKMSGK